MSTTSSPVVKAVTILEPSYPFEKKVSPAVVTPVKEGKTDANNSIVSTNNMKDEKMIITKADNEDTDMEKAPSKEEEEEEEEEEIIKQAKLDKVQLPHDVTDILPENLAKILYNMGPVLSLVFPDSLEDHVHYLQGTAMLLWPFLGPLEEEEEEEYGKPSIFDLLQLFHDKGVIELEDLALFAPFHDDEEDDKSDGMPFFTPWHWRLRTICQLIALTRGSDAFLEILAEQDGDEDATMAEIAKAVQLVNARWEILKEYKMPVFKMDEELRYQVAQKICEKERDIKLSHMECRFDQSLAPKEEGILKIELALKPLLDLLWPGRMEEAKPVGGQADCIQGKHMMLWLPPSSETEEVESLLPADGQADCIQGKDMMLWLPPSSMTEQVESLLKVCYENGIVCLYDLRDLTVVFTTEWGEYDYLLGISEEAMRAVQRLWLIGHLVDMVGSDQTFGYIHYLQEEGASLDEVIGELAQFHDIYEEELFQAWDSKNGDKKRGLADVDGSHNTSAEGRSDSEEKGKETSRKRQRLSTATN